jgi:hypothetical protein
VTTGLRNGDDASVRWSRIPIRQLAACMFAVSIRHHESRRNVVRMYNTKVRSSSRVSAARPALPCVHSHFSSRVYAPCALFSSVESIVHLSRVFDRSGCLSLCSACVATHCHNEAGLRHLYNTLYLAPTSHDASIQRLQLYRTR